MGRLSTHVLDTYHGEPAARLEFRLFRLEGDRRILLKTGRTNQDGRCDAPLLADTEFEAATYELEFGAGDYFATRGVHLATPRFVDRVPIRFGVADAGANYHVPLLVSPWAWSTYRGS